MSGQKMPSNSLAICETIPAAIGKNKINIISSQKNPQTQTKGRLKMILAKERVKKCKV